MSIELTSPAGRMVIGEHGQISVEHAGQTVLQSASAFVLIYGIEHAAPAMSVVEQQLEYVKIRYSTPNPSVGLTLEAQPTSSGFRLRWGCAPNLPAVGIAWQLQPYGPWYGHGQRNIQAWPLDRLPVLAEPLIPYDNGADGAGCITTPLWFNAGGAALLALEESGELAMTLDRSGDGLLRIVARLPEPTAAFDLDAPLPDQGPLLALDILLADDLPAAHALAIGVLDHPTSAPPPELIAQPIWTTWARYKMGVTQADVLEFADDIVAREYPRSVMEIDDRWQARYGECDWDYAKFPAPRHDGSATCAGLQGHAMGAAVLRSAERGVRRGRRARLPGAPSGKWHARAGALVAGLRRANRCEQPRGAGLVAREAGAIAERIGRRRLQVRCRRGQLCPARPADRAADPSASVCRYVCGLGCRKLQLD